MCAGRLGQASINTLVRMDAPERFQTGVKVFLKSAWASGFEFGCRGRGTSDENPNRCRSCIRPPGCAPLESILVICAEYLATQHAHAIAWSRPHARGEDP